MTKNFADRLLLIEWLTIQTNYSHGFFEKMSDEELEKYYYRIQKNDDEESSSLDIY